jgi:hypothetical protein
MKKILELKVFAEKQQGDLMEPLKTPCTITLVRRQDTHKGCSYFSCGRENRGTEKWAP